MRLGLVCWNLGKIAIVMSITILLPIFWAVFSNESAVYPLLLTFFFALVIGICLLLIFRKQRNQALRQREGFALVTFGWLLAAVLGTLPYIWSGMIPDFSSAFFESMSGFTTTGATVLTDVEIHPKSMMMWRMLTHWLGGMGIVVLVVALSIHSKGSSNLYNAETPGSSHTERLTPKISDTSTIMWTTYLGLTILLIILLKVEGMSIFDSICHAFATVSTGGFSTHNESIAAFSSPFIQWTIILFMFLCGANISYVYFLLVKRKNYYLHHEDFKVYLIVILLASMLVTLILMAFDSYGSSSAEYYIRQACFQVVSVVTTTGFVSTNYSYWPIFAKIILLVMFFLGGCFGSTAGSIKMSRWIIAVKSAFAQLFSTVHPRAVVYVRLNNRIVPDKSVAATIHFMLMYFAVLFIGAVLVCGTGYPFFDSLVAAASAITNVGPTFGAIGAVGNYAAIPGFGKMVLSSLMLIGRLEVFTVLVLLLPSVWKK